MLLLGEEVTVTAEYANFVYVFWKKLAEVVLERTGINEHTIKLEKDKQPPQKLIYSLGPVDLKTLKTYIKTKLANGFIRPSKSLAGALILFVRKRNASFWLCINYWGLNNLTIKNRYLLLLIGESLDRLKQAKRFTQLDLISAYHRMRIKEDVKWKTTFKTRYGHFEYQVMPFGLSNAPASFQGYINKILAEKLDVFMIIYLDNILIYIKDVGQAHVNAVCWVLNKLRNHSLFANFKKCCFHKDEVRFLGYVMSAQGVRMEDEQIKAVKNWPNPKSMKDI